MWQAAQKMLRLFGCVAARDTRELEPEEKDEGENWRMSACHRTAVHMRAESLHVPLNNPEQLLTLEYLGCTQRTNPPLN